LKHYKNEGGHMYSFKLRFYTYFDNYTGLFAKSLIFFRQMKFSFIHCKEMKLVTGSNNPIWFLRKNRKLKNEKF